VPVTLKIAALKVLVVRRRTRRRSLRHRDRHRDQLHQRRIEQDSTSRDPFSLIRSVPGALSAPSTSPATRPASS
jgi:hypothetical protein